MWSDAPRDKHLLLAAPEARVLEGIAKRLVLFAPLASAGAGLVSLEHDRTTLPFYSLWVGSLVLGATLLTTALMLEG